MRRVTVMEHERAVRYARGRLVDVLEPGRYWLGLGSTATKLDIRERTVSVPGQEVLTSDGVSVRLAVQAKWRVSNVRRAVESTVSVTEVVYSTLQLAARDLVAGFAAADLVSARATLGSGLTARGAEELSPYGVELVAAALKDVSFPGDLKRVFAQVAAARQEALATLERARGETAALRSLANAARLLENNPTLLRLRTLQAADGSNATVVVTS